MLVGELGNRLHRFAAGVRGRGEHRPGRCCAIWPRQRRGGRPPGPPGSADRQRESSLALLRVRWAGTLSAVTAARPAFSTGSPALLTLPRVVRVVLRCRRPALRRLGSRSMRRRRLRFTSQLLLLQLAVVAAVVAGGVRVVRHHAGPRAAAPGTATGRWPSPGRWPPTTSCGRWSPTTRADDRAGPDTAAELLAGPVQRDAEAVRRTDRRVVRGGDRRPRASGWRIPSPPNSAGWSPPIRRWRWPEARRSSSSAALSVNRRGRRCRCWRPDGGRRWSGRSASASPPTRSPPPCGPTCGWPRCTRRRRSGSASLASVLLSRRLRRLTLGRRAGGAGGHGLRARGGARRPQRGRGRGRSGRAGSGWPTARRGRLFGDGCAPGERVDGCRMPAGVLAGDPRDVGPAGRRPAADRPVPGAGRRAGGDLHRRAA